MIETENEVNKADKLIESSVSLQVLSFIAAFVVIMVNVFMRIIISKLNDFEKHTSFTDKNTSIAAKLTIARILNSSVIYLVVHLWY